VTPGPLDSYGAQGPPRLGRAGSGPAAALGGPIWAGRDAWAAPDPGN